MFLKNNYLIWLLAILIFPVCVKSQNNSKMKYETNLIEYEVANLTTAEKSVWELVVGKEDKYILELVGKSNNSNVLKMEIGKLEALELAVAIENMHTERPLKSDLLKNTILELGYAVEKVVINKLENEIFFSLLYIKNKEGDEKSIDSRPADAITQAIKFKAPIYLTEEVVKKNNNGNSTNFRQQSKSN